jgi:hemerythrin
MERIRKELKCAEGMRMAIIWDEAWNIGHARIDKQHRRWVEIFNRLEDAFLNGSDANLLAVQRDTLQEILDYTSYHFTCEESLMNDNDYPEAASHWRQHKDFANLLYGKRRELSEGKAILNSDLLLLMKNWLERHILVEDCKFVKFLETQG